MITPTLLDMAAITGLRPTGQVYNPTKFKNQKEIFSFKRTGLTSFIEEHMRIGDVTNEEHITFLTYWLTFFVFFSSSLQVAVKFVTLAIKLHRSEERRVGKECRSR